MPNEVKHDPQPAEIAEKCLEIQATWSAVERRKRSCFPVKRVVADVIDCKETFGDSDPYER
jgi:hypothetical protein